MKRREFGAGFSANVHAMALGYLYLHCGKWRDTQLIPADFVQLASHPAKENLRLAKLDDSHGNASEHYSLLWWNNSDGTIQSVSPSMRICGEDSRPPTTAGRLAEIRKLRG